MGLAEIEGQEAVRRLLPAVEAQVLLALDDRTGAVYAFRHALVAEALYDETLAAERTVLHGRLARRLQDRVESGHPRRPSQAEIAYHWYRAHEPAAALAASILAADEAARMTAFAEVCTHLDRALELWPAVSGCGTDRGRRSARHRPAGCRRCRRHRRPLAGDRPRQGRPRRAVVARRGRSLAVDVPSPRLVPVRLRGSRRRRDVGDESRGGRARRGPGGTVHAHWSTWRRSIGR